MTGDRIGFAVGNSKLIEGILKVKSQVDSGPPVYIQKVAAKALKTYTNGEPPEYVRWVNETYKKRRDLLVDKLTSLGFKCRRPKATFYIWLKCGGNSMEFSRKLLDIGVLVTPGIGFGKYGEGYVRISITQPLERIKEACERISKVIQS